MILGDLLSTPVASWQTFYLLTAIISAGSITFAIRMLFDKMTLLGSSYALFGVFMAGTSFAANEHNYPPLTITHVVGMAAYFLLALGVAIYSRSES